MIYGIYIIYIIYTYMVGGSLRAPESGSFRAPNHLG